MRLIDSDALKESIRKALGIKSLVYLLQTERAIIAQIDCAPTISAEPALHGHWVKMTGMMPPEYHGHYECSLCGNHLKGIRNSWSREEEFAFCPWCGAKMDGGDENAAD